MPLDKLGHQRNAALRRHVGEAYQARMSNIVQIDELPEVGVDDDKHPALGIRTFEQRCVARVGTERVCLKNVVPLAAQPGRKQSARAPVDKESHDSATVTADRVSLAMTACA